MLKLFNRVTGKTQLFTKGHAERLLGMANNGGWERANPVKKKDHDKGKDKKQTKPVPDSGSDKAPESSPFTHGSGYGESAS